MSASRAEFLAAAAAVLCMTPLVASCVSSDETRCPWGVVCPPGKVCHAPTRSCAWPEAVAACVDATGIVSCNFAGAPADAVCHAGVCIEPACGDGYVDPSERCDDGGQVDGDGCSADCASDETCGNGELDGASGELCEEGQFNGVECTDLGFDYGELRCSTGCTYDTSRCCVYPLLVASSCSATPDELAVDDTHVYLLSSQTQEVLRVPSVGGAVEVLATQQANTEGITLDATHVYWINNDTAEILRVPKSGGLPSVVVAGTGWGAAFTLDRGHLYWSDVHINGTSRVALTGGSPAAEHLTNYEACTLVVNETHLFGMTEGMIWKISLEGGNPVVLASGPSLGGCMPGKRMMVLGSSHLFFFDANSAGMLGTLMSLPLDGGTPTALYSFEGEPYDLAVDDMHVYWAQGREVGDPPGLVGELLKMPIAGEAPSTLAFGDGLDGAAIAVGVDRIYWINAGPDCVLSVAK